MITLIEVSRIGKFTVTASRMEVARGWEGEGEGELLLNAYRVSISSDKKF